LCAYLAIPDGGEESFLRCDNAIAYYYYYNRYIITTTLLFYRGIAATGVHWIQQ